MNTIRKTDENKELASNLVDLRKVDVNVNSFCSFLTKKYVGF